MHVKLYKVIKSNSHRTLLSPFKSLVRGSDVSPCNIFAQSSSSGFFGMQNTRCSYINPPNARSHKHRDESATAWQPPIVKEKFKYTVVPPTNVSVTF